MPVANCPRAGCRRRVVIVFLFYLSGCLTPAPLAAADQSPTQQAANGVFRVLVAVPLPLTGQIATLLEEVFEMSGRPRFLYQNREYMELGSGTAYLVSPDGHWVTNHHVVNAVPVPDGVLFVVMEDGLLLAENVIWLDENKDLALFKTPPPTQFAPEAAPLIFADPEYIYPTLAVRSIGFPGAADEAGGDLFSPKITSGSLSGAGSLNNGVRTWQHHAFISGGNSGGPLVNECGQVVGTNAATHVIEKAVCIAIDIRELLPELDRMGVRYAQASGACEPPSAAPSSALAIALGLTAVAVVAMGVFLLHLRGQIRKGLPIPGEKNPMAQKILTTIIGSSRKECRDAEGKRWKRDINGRWYRFDPAAGAVVYRKSGRDSVPASTDVPTVPGTVFLRSQNRDDVCLAPGRSIIIGSSWKDAQVVIASGYISAAHLKLTNKGGRLAAEDLRSRNGSFVNGRRLTAPAFLNHGDTLNLTDRAGLVEYRVDSPGKVREGGHLVALVVPCFLGLRPVALMTGRPVSIGRARDNNIVLDSPKVSVHHCVLSAPESGGIELRDLDSTNGTFVKGAAGRIKAVKLAVGQEFYLSDASFAFRLTDT